MLHVRGLFKRVLCWVLATMLVYATLPAEVMPSVARAGERMAAVVSQPAVSQLASPTVVSELVDRRTQSSCEYAMSDGSVRARFYTQPVNYVDSATGSMKPIDVTLAETVEGTRSLSVNRANAFRIELPRQLAGDWVSLETRGGAVRLRPAYRGARGESGIGVGSVPAASVSATDRAYMRAFDGATLSYESRPDGVKESIVVSKPTSATVYSFDLRTDGLTPRLERDGSIGMYAAGDATASCCLPKPCMWDSAIASGSAGFSDLVHYDLTGSGPLYRLDLVADKGWLADPDRVYPVTIDPGVVSVTGSPEDTYVSSGWAGTNYVSSKFIWATDHATGANYSEIGELKLGQDLVADMANRRAQGYGIVSATAYLHSYTTPNPGNVRAYKKSTYYVSSQLTWNSDDRLNTIPEEPLSVDSNAWFAFDISDIARNWQPLMNVSTSFAAVSFIADKGVHVSFKSSEAGSQVPWIGLTYYGVPTVALTTPGSGVPSLTVPGRVAWTYAEPNTCVPQAEYRVALATSAAGPAVATVDVADAWADGQLPTPPGGWRLGQQYWVQVQVASQPDPDQPALWSAWTPWTAFRAVPPAPAPVGGVKATTTASQDWFAETPVNGGVDDTATAGRGAVTLSWQASTEATSYRVYLFDGARYQPIGSTTATSWSSAGRGLYPADSAIASRSASASSSPFCAGSGFDLRDDPRALYAKTTSTALALGPSYRFKVAPANIGGELPLSQAATIQVALDNRTTHIEDDPRHTEVDLGSLCGDAALVRAEKADLTLSATDLSIPGVGPDVAVDRHYRSSSTAKTTSSPGWRFSFERHVSTTENTVTYLDDESDPHVFTRHGDVWVAPYGDTDRLVGDTSSGFTLTHKDRSATIFDASGRLAAETDANGNTVRYEWGNDGSWLVIRSQQDVPLLHERRITVAFNADGRVVRAVARVGDSDADRVVTYDPQDAQLAVVRLPATDSERTTTYRYDASGRICALAVPGFTPSDSGEAVWSAIYGSTGTSLTVANDTGAGTPRMPRTVSLDATGGVVWIASATGTSTITLDRLGEEVSRTQENTTAACASGYDADGNCVREVSPTGRRTSRTFDSRGNVLTLTDESGATTTYRYADDLCISETDPRGSVTSRAFDAAGNLLTEDKSLNDIGDASHVAYEYNGDGSVRNERRLVDPTRTAETDYADYSECGEAQKTTKAGVELYDGAAATDLVSTECFNGFGDATSAKDSLGVVTVANSLDAAGRVVAAIDASGTTTTTRYDVVGNVVETWRSNDASPGVKVDWHLSAFDGAGNLVTETVKASDGAVVSTSVHTYDAAGREVKTDDSDVPGAAKTVYDAQGNVSKSWDEGSNTSDPAAATRTTYDAEGEQVSEADPGATSAVTVTSYTDDGQVDSEIAADGETTDYSYDEAGDLATEAVSTDDGESDTEYESDLDGRTTETIDSDDTTLTTTYDLDGNEVGNKLGGQNVTATRVNVLGWDLKTVDFDGVVTKTTYDADGRVVRSDVGGLATLTAYDGCGRAIRQCNPHGINLMRTFDPFGREIASAETSGGALLRATTTTYDAAGRASREAVVAGAATRIRSTTYGADGTESTSETRRDGAVGLRTTTDGTGLLRSFAATAGVPVDWSVTATDSAGRVTASRSAALPASRTASYRQSGELAATSLGVSAANYAYSPVSGKKSGEAFAFAFPGRSENSTYSYDQAGRLTSALTNGSSTTYAYHPDTGALVGYRRGVAPTVTVTYEPTGTGHLKAAGALGYTVDALGRRIAQGPSACPAQTTYGWTGPRLTSLVTTATRAAYTYDASGQRVRSVLSTGTTSTTTDFDYDGTRLLGLFATRSDGTTWSVDYLYDADGRLFAGVYRSGAATATPFLAETTDRGDVRELLDASGAAFTCYGYDAYGNPTDVVTRATGRVSAAVAAAIATREVLRYASYAFDAESGLYYCSQRYYDPAVAAFISKDPVKADGEESAYQYCGGDPVGRTDAAGTEPHGYGVGDCNYPGKPWTGRVTWEKPGWKLTQSGRLKRYGQSAKAVEARLVSIKWLGKKIRVHKLVKRQFQAVATDIKNHSRWKPKVLYTWTWRTIAGSKTLSNHSFGIAIDVDPAQNPQQSKLKTNLPWVVVKSFKRQGARWGGDYKHASKDPMHFEF